MERPAGGPVGWGSQEEDVSLFLTSYCALVSNWGKQRGGAGSPQNTSPHPSPQTGETLLQWMHVTDPGTPAPGSPTQCRSLRAGHGETGKQPYSVQETRGRTITGSRKELELCKRLHQNSSRSKNARSHFGEILSGDSVSRQPCSFKNSKNSKCQPSRQF